MTNRPRSPLPLRCLYSVAGGLCEVVVEPLRAYSFAIDRARRTIMLKAEYDRELTDEERDDLYMVGAYVTADNLLGVGPELEDSTWVEDDLVMVPPGQPIDPLPGGIGYLRPGEQPPKAYSGLLPTAKSEERRAPYQPPSGKN